MATEPTSNPSAVVAQQQVAVTRTQVATTTRAIQDLSAQIQNAQSMLGAQMVTTPQMGLQEFQAAWQERDRLNQLHAQLHTLQDGLSKNMPSPSDFQVRLTDKERSEIRGLYASGLYTQQQLADQYGVTQPTIARIVETI